MKKFISKLVFLTWALGIFLGPAAPQSWASGDFTASPLHEFVPEFAPSAKQIAAGKEHTCALMVGGTVRCWGNNEFGQLGDGEYSSNPLPQLVKDLEDVTAIAAGTRFTCALKKEGSVWCWGNNGNGELGDGSLTDNSLTPVQVVDVSKNPLRDIQSIAAGDGHACALSHGGEVFCWGSNWSNQIGEDYKEKYPQKGAENPSFIEWSGPQQNIHVAIEVTSLKNIQQVVAGYEFTCGLQEGRVLCVGKGYQKEGSFVMNFGLPKIEWKGWSFEVLPNYLENVETLSAGLFHLCALQKGGTLGCLGSNEIGQLGTSLLFESFDSLKTWLPSHGDVKTVAAGPKHSCMVQKDDSVSCWGNNEFGQLGPNGPSDKKQPYTYKAVELPGLTHVSALAGGRQHTCAILKADHTVWCWGGNAQGQLGDGSTTSSTSPVQVEFN